MIFSLSLLENCYCYSAKHIKRKAKQFSPDKLQVKGSSIISSNESLVNRRLLIFCSGASLVSSITANYNLTAIPAEAAEKNPQDKEAEGDAGVIGAVKSFFDPNEKTKSGKLLPKGYLKAAKEVVKTLRESLEENTKDVAKFRRSADAAKESIREYLSGWRGQQAVVAEESFAALERAIRSLANFYSNAGPLATPSDEVKASILNDLKTAEASL